MLLFITLKWEGCFRNWTTDLDFEKIMDYDLWIMIMLTVIFPGFWPKQWCKYSKHYHCTHRIWWNNNTEWDLINYPIYIYIYNGVTYMCMTTCPCDMYMYHRTWHISIQQGIIFIMLKCWSCWFFLWMFGCLFCYVQSTGNWHRGYIVIGLFTACMK